MRNQMKFLAVIFSVFVLFSCKDKEKYSKINKTESGHKNEVHKIVVNEYKDAGMYAYLNVNENGNKYWIAIPNTKVNIGETYYFDGGMEMRDFESKELDKTFKSVIFAEGIRPTETPDKSKQANPHENGQQTEKALEVEKIAKAPNGISLEELFSGKEQFSAKSVIVKGKVVKVNNAILDKNWVHIMDGTNFENKNDLTIATEELVNVGDIVTFKGTVTLNKDFGYGYVYDILIEEATLVK